MLHTADADIPLHTSRNDHPSPPAFLSALASEAGIQFNGPAPWDVQVHDGQVYDRIFLEGSLGFGESYMEGLWDCEQLDVLFYRLLDADIDAKIEKWGRLRLLGEILRHRLFNLQSTRRAFQVGEQHYDTGNDVFQNMLDPSMSYSCGYWKEATNLTQAQFDKLDLICRKLELKPGERLLEIGSGWGSLAHFAAKHYGVEVVGITVSKEQMQLAQERCEGLPVTFKLMDYRDLKGQYDKVASVGMFEHVGPKNYQTYFEIARQVLKKDGLFLLHTIGVPVSAPKTDPWIDKYIFPNGKLPSAKEISSSVERRFVIEDWHNFGPDYDRTLMAWWANFDRAWPSLEEKYGQRFYRMWRYYLLQCAGFFRSGQGQLWQIVLAHRQRTGTYRSVR